MKAKILFVCGECGNETAKWYGKCPSCGSWNTLQEMKPPPEIPSGGKRRAPGPSESNRAPVAVGKIDTAEEIRCSTGVGELDRVLGGGAVQGSLVLLGGEPGIGKSTLLLQISGSLCRQGSVLYVTGEESLRQFKLRAQRLGIAPDNLYIYAETRMDDILEAAQRLSPAFMMVDSIQTVYRPEISSAPGSVTQIRESAMALMQYAKTQDVTVFIVGHVTKEGALAGPKMLEHMVDCVLYFEGERHASYRVIRAAKNRYGSTDEIGVFAMGAEGLVEVPNPSQALLSGRPKDVPGSCVACVMEGTRPILAEIQALVAKSSFGTPRRTADGFDYNRAALLLAVLERRAGIFVGNCDTYLNVVGGIQVDEPAADLPAVLALASSARDRRLREDMAAFGEVGLTGELRNVSGVAQRLTEIRRLGFSACMLPARCAKGVHAPPGLTLLPVENIGRAIDLALRAEDKSAGDARLF